MAPKAGRAAVELALGLDPAPLDRAPEVPPALPALNCCGAGATGLPFEMWLEGLGACATGAEAGGVLSATVIVWSALAGPAAPALLEVAG